MVIYLKKRVFIKNAAVLTLSGLILRFLGIVFKIWLASAIGSEGIGLYQLIFSVYILSATFATSGISTAVTRLCAEAEERGEKQNVLRILKCSVFFSLIIALISMVLLFFGADFIAKVIICDERAVISIKILCFSLPFMGVCSCFRGYFFSRKKATPNAVSGIIEQIIRIFVVFLGVKLTINKGLGFSCGAVLLGDVLSEIVSCLILWLVFCFDRRKLDEISKNIEPTRKISKNIRHIALPITSGRYLNSLLRTTENIIVPKMLKIYNSDTKSALSEFGMIKGMALPLLFFPSTLINSISTLLIPEITVNAAKGERQAIKNTINLTLGATALVSYIFAAVFFVAGKNIGILIYKSETVGILLKLLSPIVPLMYLDSISDGILKGLDKQKFTFRTSVGDSALRILLILLVLPRFGMRGFIWVMYFSNGLTCILNVGKLIYDNKIKVYFLKMFLSPICLAVIITLVTKTILSNIPNISNLVYIILFCGISVCSYSAIIYRFTFINKLVKIKKPQR